jgi:hypothetical protein
MTSIEFWQSIKRIAADGFTKSGLLKIDDYAEQFIRHQILFKRFSSNEQYGCSKGGRTHVIASLLAGAEVATDKDYFSSNDFKSCRQHAAQQIEIIKSWAKQHIHETLKVYKLYFKNVKELLPSVWSVETRGDGCR